MKANVLRILIPIVVGLAVAMGYVLNTGLGNLSSIGWGDISLLCPLGALTTMLAAKTVVPRAVVSLVLALVLMVVFGRMFCGWICPVPVTSKLPKLFQRKKSGNKRPADEGDPDVSDAVLEEGAEPTAVAVQEPLTESELASLKSACSGECSSAQARAGAFDSRHIVLLGAILSATVFGFPVFCLICPIGLAFATVFLVISLFAGGDLTWSIVLVPVLLLLEVTVFKKWCSHICPLGALMSLMGRLNRRVLQPTVDESVCIEAKGGTCGRCAAACEVGIDPHRPEAGCDFAECTKCRACVDACPVKAVSIPVVARAQKPQEKE